MLPRRTLLRSGLAVALGLLASTASARVVDEFMDASAVLSSDTAMDDPYILGGERDVDFIATATFQTLAGSGRFEFLGGTAFMGMHWDGNDGSLATNYDLPDIDLTDGGTSDRFVLDVVELTGSMTLRIRVFEDATNFSSTVFGLPVAEGRNEFLLSSFVDDGGSGADFTKIRRIQLNLFGVNAGEVLEVDRLATEGAAPLDAFHAEQPAAADPGRIDDDADVIGDEREMLLTSGCAGSAEVSGGAGRVACTGVTAGNPQLTYDGNDDSYVFDFGLGGIDLTNAGAYERVRVHVSEVTGAVPLTLSASESTTSFSFSDSHEITQPGIYDFPLGRFDNPIPIANANQIRVFSDLDAGESIAIDNITRIPSPLIDAFEGAPATVTTTGFQLATGILGNERDVELDSLAGSITGTFDVADGIGTVDVTAATQGMLTLVYDGQDGSTSVIAPKLLEDLTRGGTADRFEVTIPTLDATGVMMQIHAGADFPNRFFEVVSLDQGPGTYLVPFSDFDVFAGSPSFDEIGIILVNFFFLEDGDTLALDSIGVGSAPANPVPSLASTALLVLAGALLALGTIRSTSRTRRAA